MATRRCSLCALNYPTTTYGTNYNDCLICGEKTDYFSDGTPMSDDDLAQVKKEAEEIKARPELNPQWLIAYTDLQAQNLNGDNRTEVFYATAYDVQEAKELMGLCKRRHGADCGVRTFVATGRPPKDGGPVARAVHR